MMARLFIFFIDLILIDFSLVFNAMESDNDVVARS